MFPIEDSRGKLVGFGGRVMGSGEPKYLNSPETPLFHKGAELYGLYRARREVGKLDEVIVVEGYMDVVGLAQHGLVHSVATLGTATTPVHLQRLFRAASRVVFCFDGDRAGRKAAWRAMEIALPFMEDGRQIRFLMMPEGEDPDSLIRNRGLDGFTLCLNEALSLDSFLFDHLTRSLDMSQMDQRAKLASLARPLLLKLPAGSFKSMMYAHLGELVGVTQPPETTRANPLPKSPTNQVVVPQEITQPIPLPLRNSISILLQHPDLIEVANEFELNPQDDLWVEALDSIIGLINVNPGSNTARLIERLRYHAQYTTLSRLASLDFELPAEKRQDHLRELLSRIVTQSQRRQVDALLTLSRDRKLNDDERKRLNTLLQLKHRS